MSSTSAMPHEAQHMSAATKFSVLIFRRYLWLFYAIANNFHPAIIHLVVRAGTDCVTVEPDDTVPDDWQSAMMDNSTHKKNGLVFVLFTT
eukprot:scaffold45849_cov788-Skeletonema_marinoi.AAC.1